jgi:hypothetical protein
MAISQQALASIIAKNANGLCSPNASKMLNEQAKNMRGRAGNDIDPNDYSDEWDNFSLSDDTQPFQEGVARPSMQYNSESVKNSNIPEAIKQSMLTKHIDVSTNGDTSFLSEMVKKPQRKQVVTEQTNTATPVMAASAGVDYSIIKAIVNECLRDYFNNNPILAEGKSNDVKQITYSEKSNTIRIIKENGDVYGGKLEYQGDIETVRQKKKAKQ